MRNTIMGKEDEIEKYSGQAKRLADLNEELRGLFEEERKAMADEQDRIEDEIEQIHQQHERKNQMVKGKLFLLLSAMSVGREITLDRERCSVDQLFKELTDLAH